MKLAFASIIIVAAILALGAGAFVMVNMGPGNHANCLAAIPGGPRCLGGMDAFQLAITHINALLSTSLGIISSFSLFLLGALIALAWLATPSIKDPQSNDSNYSRAFIGTEGKIRNIQKQRRWISLLEKRDPSLVCAMNI
jgi:hypothetical protein